MPVSLGPGAPASPTNDRCVINAEEDGGEDEGVGELSDVDDAFVAEEALDVKGTKRGHCHSKGRAGMRDRSHLPCRSWCPPCARGKAKRRARRRKARERKIGAPIVLIGYTRLNRKGTLMSQRMEAIPFWSRIVEDARLRGEGRD